MEKLKAATVIEVQKGKLRGTSINQSQENKNRMIVVNALKHQNKYYQLS